MRWLSGIVALAAVFAGSALAQSEWQEYSYPGQQFAVSFPGEPSIQVLAVQAGNGRLAAETLYTARHEKGLFQVAVIEYSSVSADPPAAIEQIIRGVRARADVKLDLPVRLQGALGHYLNMAGKNGSRSVGAVYFANRRIYEIEATEPSWKLDPLSGDMIRFQQSLRFLDDKPVRSAAPEPAIGLLSLRERFLGR
jgi:hypothetical protein